MLEVKISDLWDANVRSELSELLRAGGRRESHVERATILQSRELN